MKSEIIEELGQFDLLLPSLIAEGLAANDRVKARLSVLQAAAQHAHEPLTARFDLAGECRAAGIDTMALETLVNRAAVSVGERLSAPGLGGLGAAIWADVETMIRAVKAGDPVQGDRAAERLAAIQASVSFGAADDIELAEVASLTGLSAGGGDSLHRLVMDLHKALNRLAAAHAEEVLAGAHVSALLPEDRPAVEAFMRGVEATEKLKFGHPGLGTTATRAGGRLTIQNDIGETDAHVVVITVEADAVTVIYADNHLPRAKFFTGLFRNVPVQWSGLERKSAPALPDNAAFYLITGRYAFDSSKRRDAFLETVGASLVFLIDWNKARKVLREWVSNADAIRILDWAARHRVGHRGFLQLGGAELVASAVRHAAPSRIGFGERLDQTLGRDAAADFLKTVLRVSAEALLQGSSVRLARDRIEAALVGHLQRVDRTLLAVMIRQAGLAREIAAHIALFVAERQAHRPFDCAALTERARGIEEKADRIAIEARSEIVRLDATRGIELLINQMENAIDELEQAAFVASLVPGEVAAELLEPLAELCSATVSGTEAAAVGIAAAAEVPDGHRVDTEDALAAVGRLIDTEHRADAAERMATARILTGDFNLKTALSVLDLARALERSTDRMAAFGHLLREHVLADLSA
ncbi:MAG: hypothetical protein ABSB37_02470 [Xanthobacteraceae bacterium]